MRARTAVLLAVALTAASCGPSPENPIGVGYSADPVELVGLWRVQADGEGRDTWLRMAPGEFQLWRGAGFVDGGWDASENVLVATAWGHVGEDAGPGSVEVDWLTGAHTFRLTEDGWQVLADGEPVATMRVDGAPDPIASASDTYAQAPEVDDDVRDALRVPEPLPEGLAPATTADLTGRWVPAGATYATDPHVVLREDGSWTASDGCNAGAGHWAVQEGGRLVGTAGPSTAIGCEGAPVGAWVGAASLVGLDGEELVLLDRDATELGRLAPG